MTPEQAVALIAELVLDPSEPPKIDWEARRQRVFLILLGSLRE
jgi:hypothetical protein